MCVYIYVYIYIYMDLAVSSCTTSREAEPRRWGFRVFIPYNPNALFGLTRALT